MRRSTLRLVRVAAAWTCTAVAAGCSSDRETASPLATSQPRPVSLPDLSRAEASLQRELRDRYSSVTTRSQGGEATSDLGTEYGELGRRLMAAGYLDAAEASFLNASQLAPEDMRWPYYFGHALRLNGEGDRSIPFFERALTLQPDHVSTMIWLGRVHMDQGRPELAEPLLVKALSHDPRSVAALFALGRAGLARREYARAVEHLEKALTLNPRATPVHYPLAMAYRGLGALDKVDGHLRQRATGDVTPPDPLLENLGDLLQTVSAYEIQGVRALDAKRWTEAVGHFRKGIELAPDDRSLRLNLGTALFLSGDSRGALDQFEEALRLSPGYARAHYAVGILMESAGRDQDALDRFSDAVQFDPNLLAARLSLADALRRTGRADASLEHYQRLVRLDPGASQARFGYAMALVRLRRYVEARDALAEAVTVHPDQPGFAHALARLLAAAPDDRVRDGRRSLAIMQELVKAGGVTVAETMAMALAEVGRYQEAAAWQRDAIMAARQTGRPDLARQMADNLRLYEQGEPCRTPWRDDDPIHAPKAAFEPAATKP